LDNDVLKTRILGLFNIIVYREFSPPDYPHPLGWSKRA